MDLDMKEVEAVGLLVVDDGKSAVAYMRDAAIVARRDMTRKRVLTPELDVLGVGCRQPCQQKKQGKESLHDNSL